MPEEPEDHHPEGGEEGDQGEPQPGPPEEAGRFLRFARRLGLRRKARAAEEPDPRFAFANERTFLAWIRTSLALIIAGVAVIQFFRPFALPGSRQLVGLFLVFLGAGLALGSYWRWERADRALRAGRPVARSIMPQLLAYGVVFAALIAGFLAAAAQLR